MQLTKLEIKGFKSFADKVVVNFDEGITGIVGPNGCGKSNVVDSIRWVLGETKTRVLRSEKMENIIFNGTKKRKATQLAEVSLTFNNTKNLIPTEYSQVTITRKYFRSGDSEYMLNGVVCRRKDITNLFLDTGIASNTYAIIELRMVDDLLNDKDNSRRMLFEEAAGIAKFKIRKKETLRKLGDTDDDLDRVEDLLFEIDKNLKSLERQARQAKRFYEIKEEYKESSIALAQITIQTQEEIRAKIQKEIDGQSDHKTALNTQLKDREANLEKLKTILIEKENLLSSRQKTLNDHVNNIRQYEGEKKIKSERKRFLEDRIVKLGEQIDVDKKSHDRAAFAISSLQNDLKAAEIDFKQSDAALKKAQSVYESQKEETTVAQGNLEELNTNYLSMREDVYQLNKDLEIYQVQIESLKKELEKNSEDASQHANSIEEFTEKIDQINADRKVLQSEFEKLKLSQDELELKIAAIEETLSKEKEALVLNNRTLDAKQNEFSLTKSLVDNLEGYPEAIKFLKKEPSWKESTLLSDAVSCSEEYKICIENYLEPIKNYFIVDTKKEAEKAVKILQESNQGRAGFLILEDYEGGTSFSKSQDNCLAALETLDYDSKYESLVNHLFSNVMIYQGGEPDFDERCVYLDKAGNMIRQKNKISGGSVGLFEGKRIGRAKNLETLEKDIEHLFSNQTKLVAKEQTLITQIQALKDQNKTVELENIKDQVSQKNEQLATLNTRQEQFSEMISTSSTRKEVLEKQLSELESTVKSTTPQRDKKKEELTSIEASLQENKTKTEKLSEVLSVKLAEYNNSNVVFHQKRNKLDGIKQEISFKEESYKNSLTRIESNSEELRSAEHDLNELIKKTVENDDGLVSMYEEKESIEEGVNQAEKDYYQNRASIDEEEKNIREVQRQRESSDHIMMEWTSKLNETKLALTSIKERLSVEFNLKIEEIQTEISERFKDSDEEKLVQLVEKLKHRIENIGPVNPMAMEAYEEIKERHEFISNQKEDLLKAKESLLETIGEIDTVAKATFMEAFDKIKENFVKVFRTLFTEEDDCDLFLTDPDNPLDSPIDILAKPKGKRPLGINQLSGGEKTLTATSLLFAIYLLKPAPFCIFDEVDAPLDDANIDKFNQIIREFSKDSQFIIVTHNKRTMASTDVVYGITMIEQGISRVVPVDLRELA